MEQRARERAKGPEKEDIAATTGDRATGNKQSNKWNL
jgi:hypothetical protein